MKTNYIETTDMFFICGHGVQFHHEKIDNLRIAFLEGYRWKNDPSTKEVTVYIVAPSLLAERGHDPKTIIEEAKAAVKLFFADKSYQRHDQRLGHVYTRFNC